MHLRIHHRLSPPILTGVLIPILIHATAPRMVDAATYVVTNINDSGGGSLRQAILDANGNIGNDDIAFNISGTGPHTISPLSPLPIITGPVIIDGWTQGGPGYTGPPIIEIEGSNLGGGYNFGLELRARNCLIRGLVLNSWDDCMHIFGDDQTGLADAGECIIQGNYIGLDVTGTTVPGTGGSSGIALYWSDNNTIGGTASALRNVIAGSFYEIWMTGENASGNVVQGNYIGTDVTGMSDPFSNSTYANICISDGSNNLIGGNGYAGAYNLISGASGHGVYIAGSHAAYNRIQGNVIGADVTGAGALGNEYSGVFFTDNASHSIVGGIGTGELNIIAFNGQSSVGLGGVIIEDGCTSIAVSSNQIHDNGWYGDLGIDLNNDGVTPNDPGDIDFGANFSMNYPVITSFATAGGYSHISGTLNSTPNSTFAIELFSNQFADPTGYGEGQTCLGLFTVETDGTGNASFTALYVGMIPDDYCITATSTAVDSSTSEFSEAGYYVDMVVTGTRVGAHHVLDWNAVPGTVAYWVFGESNQPYFDPDLSGFTNRVAVVTAPTLTWSTATGVGDSFDNWAYVVIAMDTSEFELARSNYTGEFDYDLP